MSSLDVRRKGAKLMSEPIDKYFDRINKDKPLAPRKGLMDTYYCALCDAYLANKGGYTKRCPVCGQMIKWEGDENV